MSRWSLGPRRMMRNWRSLRPGCLQKTSGRGKPSSALRVSLTPRLIAQSQSSSVRMNGSHQMCAQQVRQGQDISLPEPLDGAVTAARSVFLDITERLSALSPALCPAGCKVFVLDISEMAHVLGYPTCDTERFVTDPEFGTLLPNASYLLPKANLTPPMEQYTNMYPFRVLPHYESLNSGATLSHPMPLPSQHEVLISAPERPNSPSWRLGRVSCCQC